jgi:hypothetical protein
LEGVSFIFGKKKKNPLKKKHIYYLLGYKVNPRLTFFIIHSFIYSFIHWRLTRSCKRVPKWNLCMW